MHPIFVSALIEKSLVNVVRDSERTRYVLLESVRTFALEQLIAKGEQSDTYRKHVQWLAGYGESTYSLPLNERTLLAQYEFPNVRSVLEWAFAATADLAVAAARILGYFYFAWIVSGQFAEYRYWCDKALNQLNEVEHTNVIEPLMPGMILASRGTVDEDAILDTAMRLFIRRGIPNRIAWGWSAKANRFERRGQFDEALEAIQSGLDALRIAGEERTVYYAIPLVRYAKALAVAGRFTEARSTVQEILALAQGPGNDGYRLGFAIHIGEIEYLAGDYKLAASIVEEAVAREVQPDFNTAEALASLACYRLLLGEYKAAAMIAKEAFAFLRDPSQECWFDAMQVLAAVAALHAQPIAAARLIGFVDTWLQGRGYRRDRMESDSYSLAMGALREQLSSAELAKNLLAGSLLTFQKAKHEALAMLADCEF